MARKSRVMERVGKDGRVVGSAVDLGHEHTLHIPERVLGRPVHLRHTAERVGILHFLAGSVDKLAALEIAEDDAGRLHLSLMRTDGMHTGCEWLLAAVEGLEGDGGYLVGGRRDMLRMTQTPYGMGQHELGTVEKGQTLLRRQCQRLPAEEFLQLASGISPALVVKFAETKQRQTHIGQRGQVAGRAERALLIYHRNHSFIEEVNQPFHGLDPYSGVAVGQGFDLQGQHKAHNLRTHLLSYSAGMGHHQILLELRELVAVHGHVAE